MAKYRAYFKVPEQNHYMHGSVLECEDLATIWRYAYSYLRQYMYEMEGSEGEMHISFQKEIPSLSTEKDTCWKHITLISGYTHEKRFSTYDRILGFECDQNKIYVIREKVSK